MIRSLGGQYADALGKLRVRTSAKTGVLARGRAEVVYEHEGRQQDMTSEKIPDPLSFPDSEPNVSSTAAAPAGRATNIVAPADQRFAKLVDEILFLALLAGLAWTPSWFGSNRSLAWGVNAVVFGGLAVLYEIGLLITRRRHPVAMRRIWFPALAFVIVCVWALIQVSSWTPVAYQHPIWQMARETLGRDVPGVISINRDKTIIALLRFVTCGLAFWLALQLCRASGRARRLVEALAIIGALYAAYGIIAFFIFPNTILWFDKIHYRDSVTSTFINRNSYATYAGIGLTAALGLTMSYYLNRAEPPAASVGRKIAGLLALTVGKGGAWIACVFVIGIALILTGSRGGVSATVAGILALVFLSGVRGRKNAVAAGFGLLAAGLAIGVAFFNFGDFLADRLTAQGFASEDRLAAYRLTWRSIADAPLFGFGDGTFQEVFPMYRDGSIGPFGVWDKAHNSYLELLQGLGVPVAVIFLSGLALLAGRCVYAALTRQNSATAPLAASAATVVVSLHAFVDFSLQMQAVALTWAAILGAGVAQSWSGRVVTNR